MNCQKVSVRSTKSKLNSLAVVGTIALFVLLGSFFFLRPTVLSRGILGMRFDESQHLWGIAKLSFEKATRNGNSETHDAGHILSNIKLEQGQVYCNKKTVILKVFMYSLPREYHFGMIETGHDHIWPQNVSEIPRYPGGLNSQHSPEYWLTLDLLLTRMSKRNYPCTAMLVDKPKDADVFFVPYFSSLSYNKYTRSDSGEGKDKNIELQEKLVHMLQRQGTWQRYGGKNHVIVMHHPNSLHVAREQLRNSMFIVADFGRYSYQVANIEKDVVAPYKHMVPTYEADNSTFESRKTLLFFQGAIMRKEGGVIRQQLYELLKDEPSVQFLTGTAQRNGIKTASEGMRSSKFCLHLAGDTPSSGRLFDAIVSHCVPVIVSDDIELPFEDQLDYATFCIFVRSTNALQQEFLMDLLRSVSGPEWTRMWTRLKQVDHHFKYQFPAQRDNAVNMIWRSVAHKLPSLKQSLNKGKRYSRSRINST